MLVDELSRKGRKTLQSYYDDQERLWPKIEEEETVYEREQRLWREEMETLHQQQQHDSQQQQPQLLSPRRLDRENADCKKCWTKL